MIRPELWGWSSTPLSTYAWGWDEVTSVVVPDLPVKHGTGRYSAKAAHFYRSELTVNQRIQAHNGKGLARSPSSTLNVSDKVSNYQVKIERFKNKKIGKG